MKKPETNVSVLVATHNKGKIFEIVERLDMDGWRYYTLSDVGITADPEETGTGYEENARIKVSSARAFKPGMAVIADDSGLEVDALSGAPGIRSARYSEGGGDASNIAKLLAELEGVPEGERSARFVCTIVFVDTNGREFVATGTCEGRIGFAPQGDGGFGYDPVFFPAEIIDGRSMAELSPAEKDSISHRGKALKTLRDQLLGRLVADPQPPADGPVHIVAFDFDDTILEGHSPVRMIRKLVLKGVISPMVALKTTFWGIRYKLHLPVEQAAVRKYIYQGFSHFPSEEADAIMAGFYVENLRKRLRPKALEAIEKHRAEGAGIIIVSASFHPIINEVAKDVGADHFLSTRMEEKDGYYTGRVCGDPPEGQQKLIQLSEWADGAFGKQNWRLTAAYGDHRSDRFLLAAADHPVVVNPDSGLSRAAKKAGWQEVDWSFDPE